MKKALLVTRVSGFVPQFEMNNVKILQEMGYEVHYAANFNVIVYGNDNHRLDNTGIVCHSIPFPRSPFSKEVKKSFQALTNLLLEESFDLVHCHMPLSGVVARRAVKKAEHILNRKIPVMYTAHGFHFYEGAPLRNWCYYPVERHLARMTDRLIVINKEDYKRASKFPVRGSVEYIPGVGMNLPFFEKVEKGEDIRQKYDIPEDYKIVISVGELTKRKNHELMLRAMAEVQDLPIIYIICGSGPLEEYLLELAKSLGIEKRVRFTGYVENVRQVLAQSDCFVFPSFQEGLPVAVMEAMAMGLPVIASRIRGITDLVEHTKGGYLVQGFDPVDYSVKIRRIFTEKEGKSAVPRDVRRAQMGAWNQEKVKEFALPVVDRQMRRIYQEVEKEYAIADGGSY